MNEPVQGGCLCGAVRYETAGPFSRMSHCHCSMCRRQHGAAFATYTAVPREGFRLLRGADRLRGYASSPGIMREFCADCGSSLFWRTAEKPGRIDIAPGTLDGDPGVRPSMHIHVASKAPWFEIADDLPRHAASPG